MDELLSHCKNQATGSALRIDKEELQLLIEEVIQSRTHLIKEMQAKSRRLRTGAWLKRRK